MSRRPRPTRGAGVVPRSLTAVALAVVAVGALLPDRLGLAHRSAFVDAVAFRPQAAAAAVAATVLLGARRSTRPLAVPLGAVAAAGLAAAAAARAGQRPRAAGGSATGDPPTEITILAFNVRHGRADRGGLVALIERSTPDFVVLPEAGCRFLDSLRSPLDALGYRSWVSTGPGGADGPAVTLLAAPRAGALRVCSASAMHLAHLEATGGLLGHRTLYAAHTVAPVGRRRTALWRHDLAVLGRWCAADPAPLVAGDLNATLDHRPLRSALGGCRTAAPGAGPALVGTYPTRLPRWLGIQIDHVLIPADARTSRFSIIDCPGSDHRAVLAAVRLPSGPVGCSR